MHTPTDSSQPSATSTSGPTRTTVRYEAAYKTLLPPALPPGKLDLQMLAKLWRIEHKHLVYFLRRINVQVSL